MGLNGCNEENSKKEEIDKEEEVLSLSEEQIEKFIKDGVLVVENAFDLLETQEVLDGLNETLWEEYGVDVENLESTGHHLQLASSTNGSGGVLDIFYPDWKLKLATHPKLFSMTCQLWQALYGCPPNIEYPKSSVHYSPHIETNHRHFNWRQGYAFLDRVCYRLPTELSHTLGQKCNPGLTGKKKKKISLQRSLTPHLDVCPETFYNSPCAATTDNNMTTTATKWRPIQCFLALTDTTLPNTGGLEVVPGFHHEFYEWSQTRPKNKNSSSLCIGEYTHIRPVEDAGIMKRVQHVPIPANSVVFWDYRLPHANSYRNDSQRPRACIYCSFLPNIPLNRQYVTQYQYPQYQKHQLQNEDKVSKSNNHHHIINANHNVPLHTTNGHNQSSLWINQNHKNKNNSQNLNINSNKKSQNTIKSTSVIREEIRESSTKKTTKEQEYIFTDLGRKLMGIDPWTR